MPSNRLIASLSIACFGLSCAAAANAELASYIDRPPSDEVIYFVLPDRFENGDPDNDQGGLDGDKYVHGYDPTHKGFYHGGDLRGLINQLDYIQGLGATAIWLGPIYKNKPVQGGPGEETAGYHGYWITDFTQVDPHFGDHDDMEAFVEAVHARNMKVYLDIITNHTADVIAYRECHDPDYQGDDAETEKCPYRSKADYPYSTRGGLGGEKINEGFRGDGDQSLENFERLARTDYAYTPFVADAEKDVKVPAWLNDVQFYHNRGDSDFVGESSLYGDFAGLDDLLTEDPRVIDGFVDIYKDWITRYRIDGFRVDTAKHVNPEFWQAFAPAMIEHAAELGIPNFHIFGEVYNFDPGGLARYTRVDKLPAVLDFAFQSAVTDFVANGADGERVGMLFAADDLYEGGQAAARDLPVFLGNHDMGRFARFVRLGDENANDDAVLERVKLGHAMMFFLRGAPTIYYGDEQGFAGDGHDQDAREDMFPSQVDVYNDNILVATDATTDEDNFDRKHPLYRTIAKFARVLRDDPVLRRGVQITRFAEPEIRVYAASRIDETVGERLAVFNASDEAVEMQIAVDYRSEKWKSVIGDCVGKVSAPGSLTVEVPARGFVLCRSNDWSASQ